MFLVDITSMFDLLVANIYNVFQFTFSTLDSITLHGVSFLDLILVSLILGFILPIIIANAGSSVRNVARSKRVKNSKSKGGD